MQTGQKEFTNLDNALLELYEDAESIDVDDEDIACPSFSSLSKLTDKYVDLGVIGKGGMKRVVKVYDEFSKRELAMALLKADAEKKSYDLFLHEAWLIAQLDHPNIIKVHDVGITEELQPYFTMDIKSGVSLRRLLAEKANDFTTDQLLEIFLKICDALSYAHSKNILHLDLKPDNIQIGEHGEVVVCDWGNGQLTSFEETSEIDRLLLNIEFGANNLRFEKFIKGTPSFMAPEQKEGCEKNSCLTDIYGLGVILKRILKANSHRNRCKRLNAVVEKAMSLRPSDRYKSVELLQKEVRHFRLGYSTTAENAGLVKELKLFIFRNKAICTLFFIASLTLIIASVAFVYRLDQSRRKADESRKVAEKEKEKVEQALTLYNLRSKSFNDLLTEYSKGVYTDDILLSSPDFYSRPIVSAKRAVEMLDIILLHDPVNIKALKQKMYISFCIQDYDIVIIISKIVKPGNMNYMHKIIKKLSLNSHSTCSVEQFIEILDAVSQKKKRLPVFSKIIACDYALRMQRAQQVSSIKYSQVIKKALVHYNPNWKKRNFLYNQKTKALSISGNGLMQISSEWKADGSLIRFIPIEKLTIRKCPFYNLYQLKGLSLTHLDIRGTRVTDLSPLKTHDTLISLTVTPNQFNSKQLSVLPSSIKVISKSMSE